MHIWVDADACPVVALVERAARRRGIPVTLLCDTNHALSSDYSQVVVVGAGATRWTSNWSTGAGKGTWWSPRTTAWRPWPWGKGAWGIHQSGKWYTQDNIGVC